MSELATRFDFNQVESFWSKYWEDNRIFHAQAQSDKKPYSIVIPPPNVTGILHMGHALNNTLQDIIIRYKRMRGFETCWMPGTDHAGIATQNVVEKKLAKEGKTRYDVGREELLKQLWAWKKEYGGTIINQLKKLGASCDWDRTRFTMDEQYSEAVRHVFVKLYEKGLIYQGKYIINWCPRCQTALSDEEAEHKEHQGSLYHIKYPVKDAQNKAQQFLIVATTRPETMLGDAAVAVNPHDERYKDILGKTLILPLIEREIKVICDDFVNPDFGTGAVKVTPAHDPNDFAMGQRHQLEFINVMHPDGKMNELAGEFAGMDRFEAREAILDALEERKLIQKIEQHEHAVGHCYRCHTIVEPYLSKQWFVRMKPLADPAVKVVKEGKIKFYPERWTKVYLNWMENIRDWCISRQIWWGHRIPVWYCPDCPPENNVIVSLKTPQRCPQCQSQNLTQDNDVLDTWFSSWLWPFATFGWPENTRDVDFFYPTASLFTASEIIFFWVARMIMAGLEFRNEIPFADVYIHGTVRDSKGVKMSKSLGNAIDPLEIINEYGADALRFSLIINSGLDLFIAKEKFEVGRNFANKIWNASRLVLMNITLDNRDIELNRALLSSELDLSSKWIISQFQITLEKINQAIEKYRFSEAENLIYEFFWHNYCDWYLEIIKNKFDNLAIQKVAFAILENFIRITHPFMPYVTEEIWKNLGVKEGCLAVQSWPQLQMNLIDNDANSQMQTLIDIITQIRNIRAQWNIKSQQKISLFFKIDSQEKWLSDNDDIIKKLGHIEQISYTDELNMKESATGLTGQIKFSIPLGALININEEKKRIISQIEQLKKNQDSLKKRLQNTSFCDKAPREIIAKETERLVTLQNKIQELETVITNIG